MCMCVLVHTSAYAIFELYDHSPMNKAHICIKRMRKATDRLSVRSSDDICGHTTKGMFALIVCMLNSIHCYQWKNCKCMCVCYFKFCASFILILFLPLPDFFPLLLLLLRLLFLIFLLALCDSLYTYFFLTLRRTCDCNSFYFTKLTMREESKSFVLLLIFSLVKL